MDEGRYRLRDLVDTDFAALARIWTRVDPERPISEEEIRDQFRYTDEPRFLRHRRSIVEVESNTVVGSGSLWQTATAFDPNFAFAGVVVDPAHQHRGLGRRMFNDLEDAARAHRLQGLWAGVRADDPRSVRFFEAAGFREKRRMWTSRLDVTEVPPDLPPRTPERWAADGIVFTTVREEGPDRPEVREALYRLSVDAMQDVPRIGGRLTSTFEEFTRSVFRGAGYLPEAMFLARVGDRYVAFSLLFRHAAEPGVLHVLLTGTHPSYRGRGLAGELKRRTIEFARRNDYRFIETDNDSENERIWSINRQLGFRQFRTWIMGQRELKR